MQQTLWLQDGASWLVPAIAISTFVLIGVTMLLGGRMQGRKNESEITRFAARWGLAYEPDHHWGVAGFLDGVRIEVRTCAYNFNQDNQALSQYLQVKILKSRACTYSVAVRARGRSLEPYNRPARLAQMRTGDRDFDARFAVYASSGADMAAVLDAEVRAALAFAWINEFDFFRGDMQLRSIISPSLVMGTAREQDAVMGVARLLCMRASV
jgi:hypothetical protein